jgi:amino acid transporter
MELATVHVRQVRNPQSTFPKAMFFSVLLILGTSVFGAISLAIAISQKQINLISGIAEAFQYYFVNFHFPVLHVPAFRLLGWYCHGFELGAYQILVALIVVGTAGSLMNWFISPAKGLLYAAEDNYFPAMMKKENQYAVPSSLLIFQAVLISVLCFAYFKVPKIQAYYWLLTDLSTQLYLIMCVIMFLASIMLRYKFPTMLRPFKIPGGNVGMWVVSLAGIVGCVVSFAVGFLEPSDAVNAGSFANYEVLLGCGILVLIFPVLLFYLYNYLQCRK